MVNLVKHDWSLDPGVRPLIDCMCCCIWLGARVASARKPIQCSKHQDPDHPDPPDHTDHPHHHHHHHHHHHLAVDIPTRMQNNRSKSQLTCQTCLIFGVDGGMSHAITDFSICSLLEMFPLMKQNPATFRIGVDLVFHAQHFQTYLPLEMKYDHDNCWLQSLQSWQLWQLHMMQTKNTIRVLKLVVLYGQLHQWLVHKLPPSCSRQSVWNERCAVWWLCDFLSKPLEFLKSESPIHTFTALVGRATWC